MSIGSPINEIWLFQIWPWKSKVNVMANVKSNDCNWCLEFNWYAWFSFHGYRTIFCWDMANFIFDLDNLRSRSRSRSNLLVTFKALSTNYVCFSFRGNQTIFGYSKFHIWPWNSLVKVMGKVKTDGHIQDLAFNRYVCISFRGNQTFLAEL